MKILTEILIILLLGSLSMIACYVMALALREDSSKLNKELELGNYKKALRKIDEINICTLCLMPNVWLARGHILCKLNRLEEALASFDQAERRLKGEKKFAISVQTLFGKTPTPAEIKTQEFIQTRFEKIYYGRGKVLLELGRYKQALADFGKVLTFESDCSDTPYRKAQCHAALGNTDLAVENLQQAIQLGSYKYLEKAKTNSIFDPIRQDSRFQKLITEF
jgi:tetratricopeptide (TPR) repeat protein